MQWIYDKLEPMISLQISTVKSPKIVNYYTDLMYGII